MMNAEQMLKELDVGILVIALWCGGRKEWQEGRKEFYMIELCILVPHESIKQKQFVHVTLKSWNEVTQ